MEEILRRIARDGDAAHVRKLWMPPEDPVAFEVLSELRFPLVEELVLPSAHVLQGPGRETWLREMPSMRRLTFGFTLTTDALIAAMAGLPWWRQLTFLQGKFGQLDKTAGWGPLWAGTSFTELRLGYPDPVDGRSLLLSAHPQLRVLSICGQTGDEFLRALAEASLPALEDVDVRSTQVTEEGVRAFVAAPRAGLPRLRRMGIAFASDREETYHDWNGAQVGSGYEPMTARELDAAFFTGSGLRLMPDIDGWPRS